MPDFKKANPTSLTVNTKILVTSASYLDNESGLVNLAEHCQHYPTTDEIRWHDRLFTESAFSSPEAFNVMINVLKGEQQ